MPNIEFIPLSLVDDRDKNSNTHPQAQIENIKALMLYVGWTVPALVRKTGERYGLIAGHGRREAANELQGKPLKMADGTPIPAGCIPVLFADGWSDEQIRAYVIADNQVPRQSIFDESILAEEMQALQDGGLDLGMIGFGDGELERLLASIEPEPEYQTDPDDAPEVDEESTPVSVRGMVWLCGSHRVMCGDSTSTEDVRKLMAGQQAALLHADPPYGMGKEGDGVANDNLYREKLDDFQMGWWQAFRPTLQDNASAYIWGNAEDLWRLWYSGGLKDSERLTFRNEIVWAKGHGQGMSSDGFRSFAPETERSLFFMLGEQGFNNNADNYWDGWEPIRVYLKNELAKVGDIKWAKKAAGHSEKSGCHWFDASQWTMPTEQVYNSWQSAANGDAFKREYDDLKREYDDLKREFYATRAYFNNVHDNMTDVWRFDRVQGEERHGHATPKPVDMMTRVMNSSLPASGLCAEPFGGSGSTLIGAEQTGRICYSMELQEKYVDVIIKRWQQFTGKGATLENDGRTFNEIASLCP